MDIKTQLQEQVDEIRDLLAHCQCEFGFGDLERQQYHGMRHVTFVPVDGDESFLEDPIAHGDVAVQDATADKPAVFARPLRVVPVRIMAHIVAESTAATWVLWQNVVNASRQVLGESSIGGRFRLPNESDGSSSVLYDGAWYVEQDLIWRIHMWKGIVEMPDLKRDTTKLVGEGALVPMETFSEDTQEQDVDPIVDGEIERPAVDADEFQDGNSNAGS